jgi:transposase
VLDRHDLTDAEWARLELLLPDRTPRRGGRWADHRQVLNGVFWRTRCGLPWRDLPPQYGHWKTVYNRHRRWSGDGTWLGILDELRRDADVEEGVGWVVGVDAGVVRGHQHAAGARHVAPADVAVEVAVPLDVDTGGKIELQESRDAPESGVFGSFTRWVDVQDPPGCR